LPDKLSPHDLLLRVWIVDLGPYSWPEEMNTQKYILE
jgi:hypothetical protein